MPQASVFYISLLFSNAPRVLSHSRELSKPRRRRQRERHQTKGLMSRTIAVRYQSLYVSLPSSVKQQREMTKFSVAYGTWTTTANFRISIWNLTPSLHI